MTQNQISGNGFSPPAVLKNSGVQKEASLSIKRMTPIVIMLSDKIMGKLAKKLADCRDLTPAAYGSGLVHNKAIASFNSRCFLF